MPHCSHFISPDSPMLRFALTPEFYCDAVRVSSPRPCAPASPQPLSYSSLSSIPLGDFALQNGNQNRQSVAATRSGNQKRQKKWQEKLERAGKGKKRSFHKWDRYSEAGRESSTLKDRCGEGVHGDKRRKNFSPWSFRLEPVGGLTRLCGGDRDKSGKGIEIAFTKRNCPGSKIPQRREFSVSAQLCLRLCGGIVGPLRSPSMLLGVDSSKIIRAVTFRFVHMLAILFFSSAERWLRGTLDTPGIGRLLIAATWCKACRAK